MPPGCRCTSISSTSNMPGPSEGDTLPHIDCSVSQGQAAGKIHHKGDMLRYHRTTDQRTLRLHSVFPYLERNKSLGFASNRGFL